MKVIKEWSDEDTVVAALFDDGYRYVADEKSAALLDGAGNVIDLWWKEEPSGAHYHTFLNQETHTTEPLTEEMSEAIFGVGHGGPAEEQAAAATLLMKLLN